MCKEDYAKAQPYFEKAIKVFPRFALAYNNLGRTQFELGQYQKALESFDKAIKYDPELMEAYYYLGTTQVALKQRNSAVATFRTCVNKNPQDFYATKCQERMKIIK